MNLQKALFEANNILKKNHISTSNLDSEILLSKVLKKDRKYVILNLDQCLENELYNKFKKLISQRLTGKPMAYIVGKKDFWKYEFNVSNNVLIPRPDTEIIIEEVLKIFK